MYQLTEFVVAIFVQAYLCTLSMQIIKCEELFICTYGHILFMAPKLNEVMHDVKIINDECSNKCQP